MYQSHPTRVRGLKSVKSFLVLLVKASHPTRVRGLKYRACIWHPVSPSVAPHAGAWIEIVFVGSNFNCRFTSHPTRVRGLKLPLRTDDQGRNESHPTRVRGLKCL